MVARYCPLFSGSSGNCTYIGTPDSGILIDAGVSARRIETALAERGIDPRSIAAIFVTHEHSDHVCGLPILLKRYQYPVFASAGTLDALLSGGKMPVNNCYAQIDEEGLEAGDMWIKAFRTSHDSRESLGFRVECPDGRQVAVATDTGVMTDTVRHALTGCDLVHIESNHDIRMLENGPYPYYLKRRILAKTGHLSNEACAMELPGLAQKGTTRFFLAHLSKENNYPELAFATAQSTLQEEGMVENRDYILKVAPRDATEPVVVF